MEGEFLTPARALLSYEADGFDLFESPFADTEGWDYFARLCERGREKAGRLWGCVDYGRHESRW